MKEFKGKVAVITGAANGFGAEIARECVRRGMKLVLNDIDGEDLERVASDLRAKGGEVVGVQGDISIYEEVKKLIDTAVNMFGSLDLLVNNAGVYFIGTVWDMPVQDVRWMFDVNIMSVYYAMKEAIPIMLKQATPCHIVNVASIAGFIVARSMAAYHSSKEAVVAASEATYLDLKAMDANIGVTVFCPGYVQTDLNNCERHRPERYSQSDPYYQSETYRKNIALVDKFITHGEPIDCVVPNVFEAIENDRLYASTDATNEMYNSWIEKRFNNILNQKNPS